MWLLEHSSGFGSDGVVMNVTVFQVSISEDLNGNPAISGCIEIKEILHGNVIIVSAQLSPCAIIRVSGSSSSNLNSIFLGEYCYIQNQ